MATLTATAEVDIGVPASTVFPFLADASNNPTWQRGMRSCTWEGDEPPIRVGSRYVQHATFLGRDIHSVFEVTELSGLSGLSEASETGGAVIAARTLGPAEGGATGGFPITFRRSVRPLGSGRCRVSTRVTGDPGRFFGLAGPLLGWLVGRSIAADYRRLRAVLEG